MHDLDRVDHHQPWLLLLGDQADLLDAGFRQHVQAASGQSKTMGTHRDLLQRLFTRDVQGFHLLGEFAQHLQQQRTFPRAGVAADQDRTARHHAAAQYAVKLQKAGRETRQLLQTDVRKLLHLADTGIARIAA
ncbi:hypothetical protein D3C79_632860 [compost metagenome]